MLSISDIKTGKKIVLDGEPFAVTYSEHSKMGRAGAVLRTKLRNMATGAVIDKTFQGADKVKEADISKSTAQFLYAEGDDYHFMDDATYEQFILGANAIGDAHRYLTEGLPVTMLNYNGAPINIELPIKVTLTVTDAPPGIKGDTRSGGGGKVVTVETGATVSAPLFINVGDRIIINTERGEYVSKAQE